LRATPGVTRILDEDVSPKPRFINSPETTAESALAVLQKHWEVFRAEGAKLEGNLLDTQTVLKGTGLKVIFCEGADLLVSQSSKQATMVSRRFTGHGSPRAACCSESRLGPSFGGWQTPDGICVQKR